MGYGEGRVYADLIPSQRGSMVISEGHWLKYNKLKYEKGKWQWKDRN